MKPVPFYGLTRPRLKTGGERNNFQVAAIVTKAGKRFTNRRPDLLARFDQRNFDPSYWTSRTVTIAKPNRQE
jgi:hypothetical protein